MSNNSSTIIREITKLAEQYNCSVSDVVIGKHIKFYIDSPTGKQVLVCSRSASDRRALANNISYLKRWGATK